MSARKVLILFFVLALAATVIAACGGGGSGPAGGSTVTISASDDLKFTPNVINATAGSAVKVTVKNTGKTDHTFVVKDLKINVQVPAGKDTDVTFTAPAAGTYTFECDLPGHKEAGMAGQIIVK